MPWQLASWERHSLLIRIKIRKQTENVIAYIVLTYVTDKEWYFFL